MRGSCLRDRIAGAHVRRRDRRGGAPHYVLHGRRCAGVARACAACVVGRRVAVLGGGFIGLEVAAAARQLGCDVTVIDPAPAARSQRALPEVVGAYASIGCTMRAAWSSRWRHCRARSVARPAAARSSRPITATCWPIIRRGGHRCGAECRAGAGGRARCRQRPQADAGCCTVDPSPIFAAGEVTMVLQSAARAPRVRIESWQVAENQPAVPRPANLLGADEAYAELPWLRSDQYDCNLQMLGLFGGERMIVVRGDPIERAVHGVRAGG